MNGPQDGQQIAGAGDALDAGYVRNGAVDSSTNVTASARLVNRTHRVVRERAKTIQARRSTMRSLWIPLGVSAGLVAAVVFAVWSVLENYEIDAVPTGLPDASQQIFVLMMWCLPITAAVLGVLMFRRVGTRAEQGGTR